MTNLLFYSTGDVTNEVWTLSEDDCQWEQPDTLPPMETKRYSVCAVSYKDHLLVAGGWTSERSSDVVEIFNGSYWCFTQPLPSKYSVLKSAILDQNWFLMGGDPEPDDSDLLPQSNAVHYASLDSLLTSYELSDPSSVWKRLTNTPCQSSSTAVFGDRLIAIGGEEALSPASTIHAYSFLTNSWIHVGDMPVAASNTCSIVLPTGELIVLGGIGGDTSFMTKVLKASIKGNL